jgi:hypothetical protein
VGPSTLPNTDQAIIYALLADGSNAGSMIATGPIGVGELGRISLSGGFGPSQFSNTGLIEASGGGVVAIDLVYDPVKGGTSFTNSGTIEAVGQDAIVVIDAFDDTDTSINNNSNPLINNGLLYVDDGYMEIDDAVIGTGSAVIANAATLFIGDGVFAENITFAVGAHGKGSRLAIRFILFFLSTLLPLSRIQQTSETPAVLWGSPMGRTAL